MVALHRVDVGTVPFDVIDPDAAVAALIRFSLQHTGVAVRLANAYSVAEASRNPQYRDLLRGNGMNLPDGTPVAWTMRWKLHRRSITAVRGPGLMPATIAAGRADNLRHFFLGTTEDTLKKLTSEIERRYPGVNIQGTYAPPFAPFSPEFVKDCVDAIKATDAQIVWVGLGSPKQDFVAAELATKTQCVCVGVGAAFDFVAGTQKEAPEWLHHTGFEWVHRLGQEPQRLWKRYLFGNAAFIRAALFNSHNQPQSHN